MPTLDQFLRVLHEARTDEVVVTAMSAAPEWQGLSDSPLDLNYIPSSMGQAPAVGLGIALARPERRVIVINGDGCLLMNLGILVTIAEAAPRNFALLNMENGVYEFTGCQPVAGSGRVSFTGLARSAGWPAVHEYADADSFAREIRHVVSGPGPVFVNLKLEPGPGLPFKRKCPITESIEKLRQALEAGESGH
jgi:thiamine pyrophosphate-dependent acetolactate synthase large subunit-like protein